ncbi:hypothetical protein SAY87_001763 [Trapa incisa]|uniref:Ribosomal protein/NADH dehydrogenase domain-containing protein n=1 Tax=Trapa incisa TaxID=236973 RepID=A0AAN7JVJ3_9MYRT|nr:hypothetical protein SAY87_001763 [Trapa incisa]
MMENFLQKERLFELYQKSAIGNKNVLPSEMRVHKFSHTIGGRSSPRLLPDSEQKSPRLLPDSERKSFSARSFVEKNYRDLKTLNPKLPILIRECRGVEPQLWVRYDYGVEKGIHLDGLSEGQILKALKESAKA